MTHKKLKELTIFIPHKIINQAKFHRNNKKKTGDSQSYLETEESELNKHRYLGHNFNYNRI